MEKRTVLSAVWSKKKLDGVWIVKVRGGIYGYGKTIEKAVKDAEKARMENVGDGISLFL